MCQEKFVFCAHHFPCPRSLCSMQKLSSTKAPRATDSDRRACAVLFVDGANSDEARAKFDLPNGVEIAAFRDMSRQVILDIAPRLILSALISKEFDAFELSALLGRIGYVGKYRAIAPALPDKAMIVRDIKCISPTIDFDIVEHHVLA